MFAVVIGGPVVAAPTDRVEAFGVYACTSPPTIDKGVRRDTPTLYYFFPDGTFLSVMVLRENGKQIGIPFSWAGRFSGSARLLEIENRATTDGQTFSRIRQPYHYLYRVTDTTKDGKPLSMTWQVLGERADGEPWKRSTAAEETCTNVGTGIEWAATAAELRERGNASVFPTARLPVPDEAMVR